MMEFITDPVVQGIFWSIIGLAVKAACPAIVPFLGAGKKLTEELIEMHNDRETRNETIIKDAHESGYKSAAIAIEKKLIGK